MEYTFTNDFGLEAFPCTKEQTYARLPHIGFKINGLQYSIPPASYIGYKSGTCTMKIMTNKRDKTFITLGLNFFENYYSIFDIENKMIGLQTAKTTKNGLSLEDSFIESSQSYMNLHQSEDQSNHLGPESEHKEETKAIYFWSLAVTVTLLGTITTLMVCQYCQSKKRYAHETGENEPQFNQLNHGLY